MFEEIFKNAIANALQETNRRKSEEINSLMSEIEDFHRTEAIDNALKNNDRDAFLELMKKRPSANGRSVMQSN